MSTNHTPNYSLSQWQASDQVLRTDFNEDNAKIETALDSKVSKVVLHDITLTEPATKIEFDIMAEEWWKYSALFIITTPGDAHAGVINIRLGNDANKAHHRPVGSGTESNKTDLLSWASGSPCTTIIFPSGTPNNSIHSLSLLGGFFYFGLGTDFKNAKTLSILGSIPADLRIRVIGIL